MEDKTITIEGMDEAIESISFLTPERQVKIIEEYLRKTEKKFIADELKSTLNYSNATEKSITVAKKKRNKLAFKAGVSRSGYKIRWVDLGTKERKTKKGYKRGKIEGREQVSPTIDKQIQSIINNAEKELPNELNNIIEGQLKKVNKRLQ